MKFLLICDLLAVLQVSLAIRVFHVASESGTYKMSYWQAHEACAKEGAHLATRQELEDLRKTNFSLCTCGWTLDKTAHFPMTYAVQGCGDRAGLHVCDWKDKWDAYCFQGDPLGQCSAALGVENGHIHHSQMYASSEFRSWFPIFRSSRWTAQIARLHNKDLVNAWMPRENGRDQWIEVDLNVPTAITGLVTQGASRLGHKMWVTSYKIKYSKDGVNYKTIKDDGSDLIFDGNVNNDGLKRNMFPEPVLARYIRLYPVSYHEHTAIRLELLGCDMETYEAAEGIARDMGVGGTGFPVDNIFVETPPDY